MRLSSFQIAGYKNLRSPVRLDDLGPINVIHGDNNVGKSNLVEGIGLLFLLLGFRAAPLGRRGLDGYARHGGPSAEPPEEESPLAPQALTSDEMAASRYPSEAIFHLSHPVPIEIEAVFLLDRADLVAAGLPEPMGPVRIEIALRLERVADGLASHLVRFLLPSGQYAIADGDAETLAEAKRFLPLLSRHPVEQGSRFEPRFSLVKPDRSVWAEPPPRGGREDDRSSDARGVVSQELLLSLYDLRESGDKALNRRWDAFLEATARFRDILGEGRFVLTFQRKQELARLWFETDEQKIPLELQGSGVQQVVSLVGRLLATRASIVAIEEPELNLRYLLQLRLREVLEQLAGGGSGVNQVFLTSHSNAFESGDHFYAVQGGVSGPVVTKRPVGEARRFTEQDLQGPTASGDPPPAYISSEGLVQVPQPIREHLHVEQGGAVVFLRRKDGHVEMLTTEQLLQQLGTPEGDDADAPHGHD